MLISYLATAVQHICLTKSLMLIRELEFYDRSMLHLEQPVKLRVSFLFRVTCFYADLHRMTWLKRLISCSASP